MKTDTKDVNWGVPRLLSYLTTVPAAFTNSKGPSETHREIICPGALACMSNIVRDWFKSWSKMFSVFPVVFINNDKPIEADCYSTVILEKCHICELSKYWWCFLLWGSLEEIALIYLE